MTAGTTRQAIFAGLPRRYEVYRLRGLFQQHKRLLDRVQTKVCLTDRRQTGDYQTNREVRWETHPASPQFALRRDCVKVEGRLLAQILEFCNAPAIAEGEVRAVIAELIGRAFSPEGFRCPITGQRIEYRDFIQAVTTPTHGRSGYQIGHLTPLAGVGAHTADNVSWITDLGNRVQGESSLDEIVVEIFRMARYHKERLGLTWTEVEERAGEP